MPENSRVGLAVRSADLPAHTAKAYRDCESITRARAANFYYGIRLLGPSQRRAMCAVYAFARRVDDIADGESEREEKLRGLEAQAQAVAELRGSEQALIGPDPVIVALADARQRFSLPRGALDELIEGVRMDVNGITYERFEDLVVYCRRVAGAVGRLCLAIFGLRDGGCADPAEAQGLADDLGVALQLTNILRDLSEDAENGRVYLPAEDLRRFGLISQTDGQLRPAVLASLARGAPGNRSAPADRSSGVGAASAHARAADAPDADAVGRLHALVRFEAGRAQEWFRRGIELAPLLDRRSAACVLAMAGIYHRLLDRIEAQPDRALHERISLRASEKAWVATRSMLGGSA